MNLISVKPCVSIGCIENEMSKKLCMEPKWLDLENM